MDPNDFKSTIQNILELDIGEDWPESEDESELTEYASEQNPVQIERKNSEVVQITPDQRKSSTGSQTSTDSLDDVEDFCPVDINLDSLKHVLNKYEKHRKISMTKLQTK